MSCFVKIDVRDRLCVIVGGGRAAYIKAKKLCGEGARVRVVSKEFCDEILKLDAKFISRSFRFSDIDDAFLVAALTDNEELNKEIAECADKNGRLVICKKYGNTELAAAGTGQTITAAVSTGFPKLSARLLDKIMEYDAAAAVLVKFRERIINKVEDKDKRNEIFEKAVSDELLDTAIKDIESYKRNLERIKDEL